MKLTNFIGATTVVIAATLNFGAQGFPRPQTPIKCRVDGLLTRSPNDPGLLRTTRIVTPTRLPTPSPIVTPSTIPPEVAQCIRDCPVTSEYNPVCGSNGVIYNNPGRLTCARECGINVTQLRKAPCGNTQG